MSIVHCANICLWLGRDLTYDPDKEAFVNDDRGQPPPLARHAQPLARVARNDNQLLKPRDSNPWE